MQTRLVPSSRRVRLVALFVLAVALPAPPGAGATPIDAQLAALIGSTLEHNPELAAARARADALREGIPHARSLPDPTIALRWYAETPETRVGPQRSAIELAQAVPWSGKRRLDAERARLAADAHARSADDLAQGLVASLMRSYHEAAYLQEAIAVNAEEAALLARFEQIALTRYATGEGIQQSVIKVQTDQSRLVDQALGLRERLETIERRIARLTGDADAGLELDPIELGLGACPPSLPAGVPVPGTHPRLLGIDAGIEADGLSIERRRLDRRPDFRFGASWVGVDDRRDAAGRLAPPADNGKDAWSLSVGVNIPLWRTSLRAAESAARSAQRASERTLDHVRDELAEQSHDARLRHDALEQRARLYREVIVPQAQQALSSAESAYGTGQVGFLDLLDAERVLFQARLTERRLLADHAIALTDLDHALGRLPFSVGDER